MSIGARLGQGLRPTAAGQRLVAGALVVAAFGLDACGGRGASYPDGDKVRNAQKAWCQALGEIAEGKGKATSWSELASCEGAYPTGSREFVASMAKCIALQASDQGVGTFDPGQTVDDCTEQVVQGFDVRAPLDPALLDARCERLERCQDVPAAECKGAFEAMAPPEQARAARMYNLGAQSSIASCLSSSSCGDDPDAKTAECYVDAFDERVWLPAK